MLIKNNRPQFFCNNSLLTCFDFFVCNSVTRKVELTVNCNNKMGLFFCLLVLLALFFTIASNCDVFPWFNRSDFRFSIDFEPEGLESSTIRQNDRLLKRFDLIFLDKSTSLIVQPWNAKVRSKVSFKYTLDCQFCICG